MLDFGQVPMLARPVDVLPAADALPGGCVYEPKFDGCRALLYVGEGRCRIQSRHGEDITAAFPDIAAAAAFELPDGVVVDGELVVWGQDAFDFMEVQRRLTAPRRGLGLNPASFIGFDFLGSDEHDLRGEPFRVRREALEVVFVDHLAPLQIVPQTTDPVVAADWMREYAETDVGIEGLVVKGADSPYRNGEREWLKLRVSDTVEALVCGVVGQHGRVERLLLGLPTGGSVEPVAWSTPLTPSLQRHVAALVPARPGAPWSASTLARLGADADHVAPVSPTVVVEVAAEPVAAGGGGWPTVDVVRTRPDLGLDEIDVTWPERTMKN